MPGILPMKVIKVGTSAQSRIAQACDRCRSKKIRCDGITPCCSQCANVGFECKTSDKLSRRAFPRGYTESLEERVRSLESEVKELKDLLDEKDEKIDILSRIHSNSPSVRRPSSTLSTSSDAVDLGGEVSTPKEDTFRVQQSPNLVDGEETDSYFMGASSGRQFVDTFKAKVQESGKPCVDFKTDSFFTVKRPDSPTPKKKTTMPTSTVPPRMVSDQMINIFFQEWAPLFPVLHRPTFLDIYSKYTADPDSIKDQHAIAQLHLIFGISAISAGWNNQDPAAFEPQWQAALESIKEDSTLQTLQCLVIAQIYTIMKADYKKLQYYRGMAMPLSQRLGLHQSQKRFSLGALTCETRKKVFWTQYTLDCFAAAMLGLPKLFKEVDIHVEYPADVDDENVSENGFQPTLPGESTRLSSALALFKGARIMSKVLDEVYPAATSHEISLQKLAVLNDELDVWHGNLPAHLHLQFSQDKPSTNVCGSRSPILSLAFHYIRTLIHRPAVGSSLGRKADSSVVALAQSSKHIVQIIQLLEERRMSFSFCLNKDEVLLLAGFGLLYQTLELDRRGKLIQDSQRVLCSVTSILESNGALGAPEFKKVTCAMISVDRFPKSSRRTEEAGPHRKSDGTMHAPKSIAKATRRLSSIASAGNPPVKQEVSSGRRSTAPALSLGSGPNYARNNSQQSLSSVLSDPSSQCTKSKRDSNADGNQMRGLSLPNLDYLDFSNDRSSGSDATSPTSANNTLNISYNRLAGCGMAGQAQPPTDSLFSSPEMFASTMSPSPAANFDWASDLWTMPADIYNQAPASQSALSFSEDSELTSGEELSSCDLNGNHYNGIKMPQDNTLIGLEDLDGDFGL